MNKKYELVKIATYTIYNTVLYRLRALRDFGNVKAGDFGGWIASERNLSHEGDCWVTNNAKVFEEARVYEDAWVWARAKVFGRAKVCGNAEVYGAANISGNATVCGYALVFEHSQLYGEHKLDHGIWNRVIEINNKYYLISTTLKKVLLR